MNHTLTKQYYKVPMIDESYKTSDDPESTLLDDYYIPIAADILKWSSKSFENLTNFDGYNVWYDGINTFYSSGSNHYKLVGSIWVKISWIGLPEFDGRNVWTDGVNIYYSEGENHYILNNTTWQPKVWDGLTDFDGRYVWQGLDGIYYSHVSDQYKLNGNTWEPYIWEGFSEIYGDCVWSSGAGRYYSNGRDQYSLVDGVWEPMVWDGLNELSANGGIWTDGSYTYYSYDNLHYKLVGTSWVPIEWSGLTSFYGLYIWSDGSNIYHSYNSNNYILKRVKKKRTLWSNIKAKLGSLFMKYADKYINKMLTGTGVAGQDKGSGVSPRYIPAKWTYDTGSNAADGNVYTIKIPSTAGHSAGEYMSVDNGSHYYPVVANNTGRLTTHYPANTCISVIFESSGSATAYPINGGDTTTTVTGGVFRVINYYDANSYVTQTISSSNNANYRVLLSSTADDTTRTEGARKSSNFYFNPSTGNLTATKFNGNVQATTINGVTVGSSPKFTDTVNNGFTWQSNVKKTVASVPHSDNTTVTFSVPSVDNYRPVLLIYQGQSKTGYILPRTVCTPLAATATTGSIEVRNTHGSNDYSNVEFSAFILYRHT